MLRLTGIAVFLLGGAIAAAAVWGWVSTPAMVSGSFEVVPSDARDWSASWRLSSGLLVLIGLSAACAGAAIAWKKVWGFLLLSSAAAVAAVFPWVLQASGCLRYAFEEPSLNETAICVVVATCSVAAYFHVRSRLTR